MNVFEVTSVQQGTQFPEKLAAGFKELAASNNRKIIDQLGDRNPLLAIKSSNGIKTEIKLSRQGLLYVVGFGIVKLRDPEGTDPEYGKKLFQTLLIEIQQSYPDATVSNPNFGPGTHIIIPVPNTNNNKDTLTRFWELVNTVESLQGRYASQRIGGRVQRSQDVSDSYHAVANIFLLAMKFKQPQLLSRGFSIFDEIDKHITVGISYEAESSKETYREHVVPCAKIADLCIDWYEQAKEDGIDEKTIIDEMAGLIKKTLAIVLITPRERKVIDFEKGWMTDMPPGWRYGKDSIYARLTKSGIKGKLYSGGEIAEGTDLASSTGQEMVYAMKQAILKRINEL